VWPRDKCEPCNDDPSSGFRGSGPCRNLLGTEAPPIAEQIAKTYGLDSFGKIEGIRYTFNAEFPGVKLSQTWGWGPNTGQVSYEGKDKAGWSEALC
jgi:hypothetical protein